jgi:multicomponent K+:H+ antiporter subunit A
VVGISVYALLRRFRPARESLDTPPRQEALQAAAEDLLVPGVIMRFMFPVIGLLAGYLLLRGHNLPGGGFVAGLALAVAVILQYVAGGTRWAEDRLSIRPMRWMGAGLLLGGATGAGAWLFSHAFLTSHTAHLRLPVLGELHLPSAFLFDLSIFSVVVGATGLILIAIAHQSVRHPWS